MTGFNFSVLMTGKGMFNYKMLIKMQLLVCSRSEKLRTLLRDTAEKASIKTIEDIEGDGIKRIIAYQVQHLSSNFVLLTFLFCP